jgi:hypothetical protein
MIVVFMNQKLQLNLENSYDSAQLFIHKYYLITNSFDGAVIASSMQLSQCDNIPHDYAVWSDWISSWKLVLSDKSNYATIEQAYEIMIIFLETYCNLGAEEELIAFVNDLKNKKSLILTSQDWLDTVEKIVSETPRIRPYLELIK